MDDKPSKATDPKILENKILDSRIAKSEAEHWARNEIITLRNRLEEREGMVAALETVLKDTTKEHTAEIVQDIFQENRHGIIVWNCGVCNEKHRIDHKGVCANIARLSQDKQAAINALNEARKQLRHRGPI